MSKAPASGLTRQKVTTVATINAHSSRMSVNASAPRCQPKKTQLHHTLIASCTTNILRGVRAAPNPPQHQTNHAATPISTYRAVQTGPKIDAGGAYAGHTSCT